MLPAAVSVDAVAAADATVVAAVAVMAVVVEEAAVMAAVEVEEEGVGRPQLKR